MIYHLAVRGVSLAWRTHLSGRRAVGGVVRVVGLCRAVWGAPSFVSFAGHEMDIVHTWAAVGGFALGHIRRAVWAARGIVGLPGY